MILPAQFREIDCYLGAALAECHGEYLLEDIEDLVDDGKIGAYKILNDESHIVGGFVVEIVDFPRKRAVRVPLLGGDGWQEWGGELDEFLVRMARTTSADQIRGFGRRGWSRTLKTMGYESQALPVKEI